MTLQLPITRGRYRTRDGGVRIVVATDAPGDEPIVCVPEYGTLPSLRLADGRAHKHGETKVDLVERIGDYGSATVSVVDICEAYGEGLWDGRHHVRESCPFPSGSNLEAAYRIGYTTGDSIE